MLTLTRRGFTAGALPYRDLADATRAVGDARLQKVAVLETIVRARAELLAITGDAGGIR